MARKLVIAFIVGLISLNATGCNTVKGAGKDIQSVGQAGDDAIHGRPVN